LIRVRNVALVGLAGELVSALVGEAGGVELVHSQQRLTEHEMVGRIVGT
jgi:hypothetical protein